MSWLIVPTDVPLPSSPEVSDAQTAAPKGAIEKPANWGNFTDWPEDWYEQILAGGEVAIRFTQTVEAAISPYSVTWPVSTQLQLGVRLESFLYAFSSDDELNAALHLGIHADLPEEISLGIFMGIGAGERTWIDFTRQDMAEIDLKGWATLPSTQDRSELSWGDFDWFAWTTTGVRRWLEVQP